MMTMITCNCFRSQLMERGNVPIVGGHDEGKQLRQSSVCGKNRGVVLNRDLLRNLCNQLKFV